MVELSLLVGDLEPILYCSLSCYESRSPLSIAKRTTEKIGSVVKHNNYAPLVEAVHREAPDVAGTARKS